jgi:hypothetical protein
LLVGIVGEHRYYTLIADDHLRQCRPAFDVHWLCGWDVKIIYHAIRDR